MLTCAIVACALAPGVGDASVNGNGGPLPVTSLTQGGKEIPAPVHWIGQHDNKSLALWLGNGGDPNMLFKKRSLLSYASEADTVALLLSFGADQKSAGGGGMSCIEKTACFGLVETMAVYLAFGGSVNSAGLNGTSLLMRASACGRADMVQFLIDNRVDVGRADNYGFTALHYAAGSFSAKESDILAIVECLLKYEVNPSLENRFGKTAKDLAVSAKVRECLEGGN